MEQHGTKFMHRQPRLVKSAGKLVKRCTLESFKIRFSCHMLCSHQAAIDSITRSLALEWGEDHGILVNGIAPGAIEDTAGVSKLAPEEVLSKIKEKPLYTFGEKWDIAMAALYLASDAGS